MPKFRHDYHRARDYGWPFGVVGPGQVVEHVVNPEPNFFSPVPADTEKAVDEAPVEVRADSRKTRRAEVRGLSHESVFGHKVEQSAEDAAAPDEPAQPDATPEDDEVEA